MVTKKTLEERLPLSPFGLMNGSRGYAQVFIAPSDIFDLSVYAKALLLYIICNLKPGKNYVELIGANIEMEVGIKSRNTMSKVKEELARHQIIAHSGVKSVYFINPKYFFRHD